MIRLYLDWNVISSLKRAEFADVKKFINDNKDCFEFVYTPAHFTDLMKSYNPDNKYFDEDLDMLDYLANKHLLRWNGNSVECLLVTPKEYFIKEKENVLNISNMNEMFDMINEQCGEYGLERLGTTLKDLLQLVPISTDFHQIGDAVIKKLLPNLTEEASLWDLLQESSILIPKILQDGQFYKDIRAAIGEQGFKLEANSGNWSYDTVIKNIDNFLANIGSGMKYIDYINLILRNVKKPISQYEYYMAAYLALDMIGYKVDKLPKKTDNMQNITTDSEHSFYAAHCDYFVAMDKKLIHKSKVLYNEFNISTKIIELSELISELSHMIDKVDKNENIIDRALSFCEESYLEESILNENEENCKYYIFRLPKFYFNYFNYLVLTNYTESNLFTLTFKKVFKNWSRFIYYTEAEKLVDTVLQYFGYGDRDKLESQKKTFVYQNNGEIFEWRFDKYIVILEQDKNTERPILTYIILKD